MKQNIVIWGASGHAKVVADIIIEQNKYQLSGFLDDVNKESHGKTFCGLSIFGGREKLSYLKEQNINYIILGFGNCQARLEVSKLVLSEGFNLGTAIHPAATIAKDVDIGDGTVIAAGAVINAGVTIGKNVIINTLASVDHDCTIEDGVHICPGVKLAGGVRIGEGTWVGIGSTIIEKITINSHVYVGAGSLVLSDIPAHKLVYGAPAKVVKDY